MHVRLSDFTKQKHCKEGLFVFLLIVKYCTDYILSNNDLFAVAQNYNGMLTCPNYFIFYLNLINVFF